MSTTNPFSLQDDIARVEREQPGPKKPVKGADDFTRMLFHAEQRDAALARLALCREWIKNAHTVYCERFPDEDGYYGACNCGRDALLKMLENKP